MTEAEAAGREHGTVARNAFYLVLGQATTTALAIVFSAALGRTLGVRDFGVYFLIASFSTFAYVLVDWGQQFYVIREVARAPERGSELLGTALVLRTVGAALVAIPSGLVAWALGYDASTCWYSVAFIAVSLPFFLAQSYGMVFRGRDRMGLDAAVSVVNKIALLALALALLALGTRLPGVLVAHALAGFLALALATRLYRRVATGPLRYSPRAAREILAGGGALFIMIAASNVQPYIDVVILSKLAPADAVGWYGAAKNILGTMLAPAALLSAASFPRLTRAAAASRDSFRTEARAALRSFGDDPEGVRSGILFALHRCFVGPCPLGAWAIDGPFCGKGGKPGGQHGAGGDAHPDLPAAHRQRRNRSGGGVRCERSRGVRGGNLPAASGMPRFWRRNRRGARARLRRAHVTAFPVDASVAVFAGSFHLRSRVLVLLACARVDPAHGRSVVPGASAHRPIRGSAIFRRDEAKQRKNPGGIAAAPARCAP